MSAAAFNPEDIPAVEGRLVAALSSRVGPVSLAGRVERISGGLDTYVYGFRLSGDGALGEWTKPLILRVYTSPEHGPKAEREFAVQRFVSGLGFPAPSPLVVEADVSALGLPFMVMRRVPGTPVLDRFKNPVLIPRMLTLLADTHARLHELPVSRWPLVHDGPLVERLMSRTAEIVEESDLKGPRKGLEWLQANIETVATEEESVCHGDFHPLNILLDKHGRVSVVDWTDADVGDRHSDIARTTALFWLAPPLARSGVERTLLTLLRGYLVSAYLRRYERHLQVERGRLRYWQTFHATYAWAQIQALKKAGAEAMGARAGAAEQIPDTLTFALKSYIQERIKQAD